MSELNIPESWASATFDDVISFNTGYAFKSSEFKNDGTFVLRVTNINNSTGKIEKDDCRYISENSYKEKYQKFALSENDVLIVMVGASTGKIGLVDKEILPAALNQNMWNLKPYYECVDKKFLYYFLNSVRQDVLDGAGGSARGFIKQSDFKNKLFPLPPRSEQKRIVDKIDSCFEAINETEQNLTRIEILFSKYRESLLGKAFRGELVEQDPSDESVSALLANVREERETNQKNKKKKVEFAPVSDDEKPFDIPESWEWVRFGELSEFINGDRGKNYPNREEYVEEGVAWINTGHIQPDGSLNLDKMHYITREKYDSLRSGKIQKDDMVYCLRGATIGKTAFVEEFNEGAIASSLMIIRLNKCALKNYIFYYLTSFYGKSEIKKFDNGSAQPNLSANSVGKYMIPLPPIAEQKRIINKLKETFSKVEETTTSVLRKNELSDFLKNSILQNAFEGRLVEQIKSEGTGHELLQEIIAMQKQVKPARKKNKKK